MAYRLRGSGSSISKVIAIVAALCSSACNAYDSSLLLVRAKGAAGNGPALIDSGSQSAPDTGVTYANPDAAPVDLKDAALGDAGGEIGDAASQAAPDACTGVDCCVDDPQHKSSPGVCGCGVPDTDSDSDGTPDCKDECPSDPGKTSAGTCGCGTADADSDSDGVLNCMDACPADPGKTSAGMCGCGVAEAADCKDDCPDDPAKKAPGSCGCGVADSDSDADGTPDCQDACANDPVKTSAGMCGCGVADTDSDSDGVPNCSDGCASDPDKSSAGVCGCGLPDVSDGCVGLRDALAHRYSFNGSDATVTDAKGGSSGTARNAQLSGNGSLVLSGTNQYVEMPTNMISGLTNATLESWVRWTGSTAWQRVFDCGNSVSNQGVTYLFLTASAASDGMRAAFALTGNTNQIAATAASDLPANSLRHVAVVVDDAGNALALYQDGKQVARVTFSGHLSSINFANCFLGRSLYSSDPYFKGTLYEFRVYDAALTAGQLLTSFNAGPDATFF